MKRQMETCLPDLMKRKPLKHEDDDKQTSSRSPWESEQQVKGRNINPSFLFLHIKLSLFLHLLSSNEQEDSPTQLLCLPWFMLRTSLSTKTTNQPHRFAHMPTQRTLKLFVLGAAEDSVVSRSAWYSVILVASDYVSAETDGQQWNVHGVRSVSLWEPFTVVSCF